MSRRRDKFIDQWFIFDFNGSIRRAKCIDIEFEGGVGPQFFFKTNFGNTFRLSRREVEHHEICKF
jgi:hypothetical protein